MISLVCTRRFWSAFLDHYRPTAVAARMERLAARLRGNDDAS